MKIGILVLSIGSFGTKGFYNLQEVGLAKALSEHCEEVIVYKLIPKTESEVCEIIEGTSNAKIHFMPSNAIGTNGIPNLKKLNKNIDVLICFSDTQLMLLKVYRWTKKNQIGFLPYIGVIESHSTSEVRTLIINLLFNRNKRIYKKCTCLAKTPEVKEKLGRLGIGEVELCPIGLDLSLVKKNYECFSIEELKEKYGYTQKDKVILFIGRMIKEKEPLKMVTLFSKVREKDPSYKLLIVGSGELLAEVKEAIQSMNLYNAVKIIERIPNEDIWQLYRIAECLVNLNQREIYGMVLLEAMYYECKVVAWKAPGPNFIVSDKETGYLVSSDEEIIEAIELNDDMKCAMKKRVIGMFTWSSTAIKIMNKIP